MAVIYLVILTSILPFLTLLTYTRQLLYYNKCNLYVRTLTPAVFGCCHNKQVGF